jgi:hypothetical protein
MSLNEYFEFLDALREGGTINMFGAPRELQEEFGISKEESFEIFQAWTEKFNN